MMFHLHHCLPQVTYGDSSHLTFELCRFLVYEYMANGSLKDHLHCMISFISDPIYAQSLLNRSYIYWFVFLQHLE